ncbi:MAG: DUF1553 domain-containing protein, partial [Candidatus Hydrogenedentes bacterium]|nr:DUF1553 domain-containing protein [Candidatus Hydrogenedentota bacterium]
PDEQDPEYQDYLKQVAEKEEAVANLMAELHTGVIAHAREKIVDYLLAAHDARPLTDEEPFRALARDRQLLWQLLRRWSDLLKQQAAQPDPVFAAWIAFAALPEDSFAEEAAQLAKQIAEGHAVRILVDATSSSRSPENAGSGAAAPEPERRDGDVASTVSVNARIAKIFEGDAPKTMAEVAERYRILFRAVDKEWTDLLALQTSLAQQKQGPLTLPAALNDPEAEAIRQVLYGAASPANVPEGDVFMLSEVPVQGRVRGLRNALQRVKNTHPGRPDRAMALQEGELFAPYVFLRGKSANKGEDVPRQFLAVLSAGERKPFEHGSGRLDLADAIASPDNPLTARVLVNRLWLYHFGRPLVDTTSDFGLRSEAPSHPDLLDYLARRLMDDGWSVKKLQRAIVLSSAYQQSSAANPDALMIDPENRLLWRQNRQRLDFEALRDAILATAGTLDVIAVGGPSVDVVNPPYSPRRSLYAYIDRQNLPALFRTFDFATPDTHSPRRFRTTVPQQALFMMNSPFMIEQARAFSVRAGASPAQAVAHVQRLYQLALQREPAPDEIDWARQFAGTEPAIAPPPSAWQYGYGSVDEGARRLHSFTPLTHFSGGAWKGGKDLPDLKLGWVHLTAGGGHPGDAAHAAIRRWIAPRSGIVSIAGQLTHDAEQGDGVIGYIISSHRGIVWRDSAFRGSTQARVDGLEIAAGETLDFVIACGGDENSDGFGWAPAVKYQEAMVLASDTHEKLEYRAAEEFQGPLPPPLEPWEKLAQVLLCTNEFLFLD